MQIDLEYPSVKPAQRSDCSIGSQIAGIVAGNVLDCAQLLKKTTRRIPMAKQRMTRRHFIASTTGATALTLAAPHVSRAQSAGKLSLGLWDHWVPGANDATTAIIKEWGAKEKVDVTIDYITSQGNKNLLTIAAESQAKSGHDIFAMPTWWPQDQAKNLEPVNDIMEPLIKQNGAVNATVSYLGQADGKWLGVPSTIGSQIKGPCTRIDLFKKYANIDIQAMYPVGGAPKADVLACGPWARHGGRRVYSRAGCCGCAADAWWAWCAG